MVITLKGKKPIMTADFVNIIVYLFICSLPIVGVLVYHLIRRREIKMEYTRAQYLADSRYGNLRTIVGSGCGRYFLQYSLNANIYVAGCRFFTPKQALKHWRAVSKLNQKDEPITRIQRAKTFVKAIEEHQLSLKGNKK